MFSVHLYKFSTKQHNCRKKRLRVCLVLCATVQASAKGAARFAFPTAANDSSCCSTSSPRCGVVSVLKCSHLNMCVVYLIAVLISHSLVIMLLNIDLYAYLSSIHCLQWGPDLLSIFHLGYLFSYCWGGIFFFLVYFVYYWVVCILWIPVNIRYVFCKYSLPVCGLSFQFHSCLLQWRSVFPFDTSCLV